MSAIATHIMTVGELREMLSRLDGHDKIKTSQGLINCLGREDEGGRIFQVLELDSSTIQEIV